jgi:hypothetical protein
MKRPTLAILTLALTLLLAVPAAADAAQDLGIAEAASANVVKGGGTVTFAVTVSNSAADPYEEEAIVDLFSLSAYAQPANNPYVSFSSTQGSCEITPVGQYQQLICRLGPLAPGASARITADVTVNQSMTHIAALLPTSLEGTLVDANNANNEASAQVIASVPPTLTGSSKLKLPGLPQGCVSGNFKLKVRAAAANVKKLTAVLFLGFDASGEGHEWRRAASGSRLSATVPASQIEAGVVGQVYKLKIKARRKGAPPLKRTVEFQLCD